MFRGGVGLPFAAADSGGSVQERDGGYSQDSDSKSHDVLALRAPLLRLLALHRDTFPETGAAATRATLGSTLITTGMRCPCRCNPRTRPKTTSTTDRIRRGASTASRTSKPRPIAETT